MSKLLDWVMGGDLPKGTVHVYGERLVDVHYMVQPSYRNCQEDESIPVVQVQRLAERPGGAAFIASQLTKWMPGPLVEDCTSFRFYGIRTRFWRETHGRTVLVARYDENVDPEQELWKPKTAADVVVVADYDKGYLTPSSIQQVIDFYGDSFWNKLVIDHGNNYSAWNDCREFQPSIVKINHTSPVIWSGTIVTSPSGIGHNSGFWPRVASIQPKCLNIFDPCGCGDVVLAVLAMARLFEEKVDETVSKVCMAAAAVEYGKLGATPVTREEIKVKYLEAYGE